MIKHIVLWKLKSEAEGRGKQANAIELKRQLENLHGKIPGLLFIEVGINLADNHPGDEADVMLYSEFTDLDALKAYHEHPEHQKIVPFARAIRDERRVIDYEVL
jgi:antibiotic biosynthesis monooxygenase (ABM) superfamily enzyme